MQHLISSKKLIITGILTVFAFFLVAPLAQVFAQAQTPVVLSSSSVTMPVGGSETVSVAGGQSPYSVQAMSPAGIITVTAAGATLTITALTTPDDVNVTIQDSSVIPQTANLQVRVVAGNTTTTTTTTTPTPGTGGTPSQEAPGPTGNLNGELSLLQEADDKDLESPCTKWQFGCSLLWWTFRLFFGLSVILAQFAGYLFDFFLWYTMRAFTYLSGNFVVLAWGYMRDLANLLLICSLLYAAALLVMGDSKGHRIALNTVLIAFVVNFSLYIAGIPIDVSHILARVFYNQITSPSLRVDTASGEDTPKAISTALIEKMRPQRLLTKTTYGKSIGGPDGIKGAKDAYFTVLGLSIIVNVTLITLFLSIGFLFIGRTVALIFALIISPLAFVTYALPLGVKFIAIKSWWEDLVKNAFMLPIFLFFLYLIVLLFNIGTLGLKEFGDSVSATDTQELLGVALPLIFVLVFLKVAKKQAEGMASEIAITVSNASKKIAGAAVGVALGGVALGATAVAGPAGATFTSMGAKMLAGGASKTGFGGAVQRRAGAWLGRRGKALENSTGDVRNVSTKIFGQELSLAALGATAGLSFGKGRTDSSASRAEERQKKEEARMKEELDLVTKVNQNIIDTQKNQIALMDAQISEIQNSDDYKKEYKDQEEAKKNELETQKDERSKNKAEVEEEEEKLKQLKQTNAPEADLRAQRAILEDKKKEGQKMEAAITDLEKQIEDGSFFIEKNIAADYNNLKKEKEKIVEDIKKKQGEIDKQTELVTASQKEYNEKLKKLEEKKQELLNPLNDEEDQLVALAKISPLTPADQQRLDAIRAEKQEVQNGTHAETIALQGAVDTKKWKKEEEETKLATQKQEKKDLRQSEIDKNKKMQTKKKEGTIANIKENKKKAEKEIKKQEGEAKTKRIALAKAELDYIQSAMPVLVKTILGTLVGGTIGLISGAGLVGGLARGAGVGLGAGIFGIPNQVGPDLKAHQNALQSALRNSV